ncbi:MAG: hypothetical protein ABI321_22195 [Polyangia bacterium]
MPTVTPGLRARDLVAPFLLLIVGFCLFPSSGRDDCYITFWPAETFSLTGHVLNYNGEAVEQSSTLLFVLLLGSLRAVTRLPISLIAYVASVVFGILTVLRVGALVARVDASARAWAMALAASTVPLLYWMFSATEMTCVAFLGLSLVSSIADATEDPRGPVLARLAAWTLAFLLVRPEAPLVLIGTIVAQMMVAAVIDRPRSPTALRRLAAILAAVAAAAAMVFVFRRLVFHEWFPLPVRAKTQQISMRLLREGWTYTHIALLRGTSGASVAVLLVSPVALYVVRAIPRPVRTAVQLCVAFAWVQVAFVITCGGDWMEVGRFFVLALALACVPATLVFAPRPRLLRIAVCLAVAVNLYGVWQTLKQPKTVIQAVPVWALRADLDGSVTSSMSFFDRYNATHHRDRAFYPALRDVVKKVYDDRHGEPLTVLSGQAGDIMIELEHDFDGRIRFIDAAGLSTRHFPDCPLAPGTARSALGMVGLATRYIHEPRATAQACHFELPEIMFGRHSKHQYDPALEKEYTIVVSQSDTDLTSRSIASRAYQGQFAMVRTDIATRLGLQPVRITEAPSLKRAPSQKDAEPKN